MPNHTIYIRKEDQPKWDAIGDKSGWVREKLHDQFHESKNIKVNTDGTVSPIDPAQASVYVAGPNIHGELQSSKINISKPPEMSDMRWLQHLKDNGIDLADTSVDTNPDWGA